MSADPVPSRSRSVAAVLLRFRRSAGVQRQQLKWVLLEAAAYFIACEGLTNAVKHAAARRVVLEIARQQGQLVLTVADDGMLLLVCAVPSCRARGHPRRWQRARDRPPGRMPACPLLPRAVARAAAP